MSRTTLGRRGYNEEGVDLLLARLARDVEGWIAECANLRAENHRLKAGLREWHSRHAADHDLPPVVRTGDVDAVRLISRAQQEADSLVAQSQDYARKVANQARQQAEDILWDAQRRADEAAEHAVQTYRNDSGPRYAAEVEEMERRLAWLRTFVHAIQVQLTATTEAFNREIGKLSDIPSP